MSNVIDSRVVEMLFDNKQFESATKTSMGTLDKLKNSLKFDGATKGFTDLNSAAKSVDMASLGEIVVTVQQKFSALGVIAITALVNIANQAINTGKQLLSSLTIDQVSAGWSKYAEKTSAVQTIMAATAKDFADTEEQMGYVNDQLEKLNWFTDETSYNFLDMVNNIGKFTSNQIPLDDAVTSMQGISTWAAISGANTQEASRAMYNLSQAISIGAVKLMDWRSIENANMATAEFKETVIATAEAQGMLIKTGDGLYETMQGHEVSVRNFNEALSDGWFTTEVLMEALDKYGGFADELYQASEKTGLGASQLLRATKEYKDGTIDMASWTEETGMSAQELTPILEKLGDETYDLGNRSFRAAQEAKTFAEALDATFDAASTSWMNTFEIIFGDYEKAKVLWTDLAEALYDIFVGGGEARNELLRGWVDLGGRESMIEAWVTGFRVLSSVANTIKDSFRDIFPPMTSERLFAITENVKNFMHSITPSESVLDRISRAFSGLFAAVDLVGGGLKTLWKIGTLVFQLFVGPMLDGLLSLAANFGDFWVNLRDSANEMDFWGVVYEKAEYIITNAADIFWRAIEKVREGFEFASEKIGWAVDAIKTAFTNLKNSDTSVFDGLSEKWKSRLAPLEAVANLFKAIVSLVVKAAQWAAPILSKWLSIAVDAVTEFSSGLGESIKNLDFQALLDLFNTGTLALILWKIKDFVTGLKEMESFSIIENIKGVLGAVTDTFAVMQQSLKAKILGKIAKAILMLAAALVILALIPSDKLGVALASISVLFLELTASMSALSRLGGLKNISTKLIPIMLALSAAILVLSFAMLNFQKLDWEGIAKGTITIAILGAELVLMANMMDSSARSLTKAGPGLIALSAAVLILSKAMGELAELSWEELAKGLVGVTAILLSLGVSIKLMGSPKRMISTGLGILAISAALHVIASAIKKLGQLTWEEIAKGLVVMAGALLSISAATALLPKGMINKSTGILLMAAALQVIASVMSKLSVFTWEEIAKGLSSIAGVMLVLSASMHLLPDSMVSKSISIGILAASILLLVQPLKSLSQLSWEELLKGVTSFGSLMAILVVSMNLLEGNISGAATLLILAPALLIFSKVLKELGAVPYTELMTGLGGLAALFVILGLSATVLAPLTGTLLAITGAVALLGAGILAIGVGALAFSSAMALIAVGAAATGAAIQILGAAIFSLIPIFVEKMGEAAKILLQTIIDLSPLIAEAVKVLISDLAVSIVEMIPVLVNTVLELVLSILTTLDENATEIVDKLFSIVIQFLDVFADRVPELVKTGGRLLRELLSGIFAEIGDLDPIKIATFLLGMTSMVALFALMASAKATAKDALITGGIMAVVLGVMSLMFLVISQLEIDDILDISLSLSAILLAISASMTILAMIPVSAALSALGSLTIFVAGLTLLLAALGGIMQIPGVEWLLGEGVKMLGILGSAIGSFVGGIISGVAEGLTKSLPTMAQDLSDFMANIQPFIEGAKEVDAKVLAGVGILVGSVLALTAANVINTLSTWLTGGTSLTKFGKEIADFAPYLKSFSDSLKGLDTDILTKSANAAKTLTEFYSNLPKQGGIVQAITGTSSITAFAEELSEFGPKLYSYYLSVKGLNGDVVEKSANAALALANLANNLPKKGGLSQWFTGEQSLADFAEGLADFGPSLGSYYNSVKYVKGDIVESTANAALALANLANNLPKKEGLVQWFTGEQSLSDFAEELVDFAPALKKYYLSVKDIKGDVVESSANAALALANLATNLPRQGAMGGIVDWFTGEQTLSSFAEELSAFGPKLYDYYKSVRFVKEDVITSSANAASALFEMAKNLPSQGGLGGIVDWFTGDQKLSDFAEELSIFGPKLYEYYKSIRFVDEDVITSSANAATALFEMARNLPQQEGIKEWFFGANTLSGFAEELSVFGPELYSYSRSVRGMDEEVVTASANAASALFEMAKNLPEKDGISEWFTGGQGTLSEFAEELSIFGPKLFKYHQSVMGMDEGVVIASANAASALFEMASNLPDKNGIADWFSGGQMSLSDVGEELAEFGPKLYSYYETVRGIKADVVTTSADAGSALFEMANNLPDKEMFSSWFYGDLTMATIGEELSKFAPYLYDYYNNVRYVKEDVVTSSANAAMALFEMAGKLPDTMMLSTWISGDITLSSFAEELVIFGPLLKQYYDSIKGVKEDVVTSSANAAIALFEMADNLPEKSTLDGWRYSLSGFAEELVIFGPYLKQYYDSIKGVKEDVITASANAASALFEMADNLPEKSVFSEWFTSGLTLSGFGEELVIFGPLLKQYYDTVKGIDEGIVTTSANAARSLLEMASNLPDQDSANAWVNGSLTLSTFGEQLSIFAPYFAEYAEAVKGIDAGVVTSSANAGKALAELANALPEQGGLSQLWSGSVDIGKFGSQMSSFGDALYDYYESVKDINTYTLSKVMVEFEKMVGLAGDISFIEPTNLSMFSTGLRDLGRNGADEFITAFEDAYDDAVTTGGTFIQRVITGAENKEGDIKTKMADIVTNAKTKIEDQEKAYEKAGKSLMTNFLTGIEDKHSDIKSSVSDLLDSLRESINDQQTDFKTVGGETVTSMIGGIDEQVSAIKTAFETLMTEGIDSISGKYPDYKDSGQGLVDKLGEGILGKKTSLTNDAIEVSDEAKTGVRNTYMSWRSAGQYVAGGFGMGISSKTSSVAAQAKAMAQSALTAARNALQIKSPSKETEEIGEYFGMGFINALIEYTSKAYDTSYEMASSAKDGLTKAVSSIASILDSEIETSPTIKPVLDLSEIKSKTSSIDSLLSRKSAWSISTGLNRAAAERNNQNGRDSGTSVTKINVDNRGLLEGAVFEVREEADISKIAKELDRLTTTRMRGKGYDF